MLLACIERVVRRPFVCLDSPMASVHCQIAPVLLGGLLVAVGGRARSCMAASDLTA